MLADPLILTSLAWLLFSANYHELTDCLCEIFTFVDPSDILSRGLQLLLLLLYMVGTAVLTATESRTILLEVPVALLSSLLLLFRSIPPGPLRRWPAGAKPSSVLRWQVFEWIERRDSETNNEVFYHLTLAVVFSNQQVVGLVKKDGAWGRRYGASLRGLG